MTRPKNPNPVEEVEVDYYNTAPIFFDIETMALGQEELKQDMPFFEAPKTYKKQESIDEYIEKKRAEYIAKAALSPLTGRVLAIGIKAEGVRTVLDYQDEKHTLKEFWKYFRRNSCAKWVGHNSNSFDWPFLIKRSWKYNLSVPTGIKDGRYYCKNITDTMELFCSAYGERISLDRLGRYFGVGEKNGSGKHFAELYYSNKDEAITYLYNDLDLTEAVWERMQ